MSTDRSQHSQRRAATGADAANTTPSFARRHWAALSAGAVIVLVVAALAALSAQRGAPAGTQASAPVGDGGVAPAFSLTTLEGKQVSVPAGRPGAVFFTVSSCVSCIAPAKELARLKERVGDRADVLLVSMDPGDTPQAVRQLTSLIGDPPPYPSAIDTSGTLAAQYGITALGTTVVYDQQGRIVDRLIEPGADELTAAFRQAGAL